MPELKPHPFLRVRFMNGEAALYPEASVETPPSREGHLVVETPEGKIYLPLTNIQEWRWVQR